MNYKLPLLIICVSLFWPHLAQAQASQSTAPDANEQAAVTSKDKPEKLEQESGKEKTKNLHAHLPQHEIIVGKPLPTLVIEDYGEVVIVDEEQAGYQPWRSDKALNRVHLIHYLAGRRSASKRHKNFSDQLEALELDFEKHHVTTIINANDAFLGTSKLVASRLDNSKRDYPKISVVGDKTGLGAHIWSLKRKGSAIIIVSADGIVLFIKQDKFNQPEIDSTLELLQSHMAP